MSPEEMIAPEDIETNEGILRRLEEIEQKIAEREILKEHAGFTVREQIVILVKHQVLPEDDLIAEWLDLYSTHTYWSRRHACEHPRAVSASVYDSGNGELQVWGVSFTLKGHLKQKDGKVDEADRMKKAKLIEKILAKIDFSDIEE